MFVEGTHAEFTAQWKLFSPTGLFTGVFGFSQEFFSSSGSVIPEIESELWLKTDKKGWKRHHFVLRGSGIYYSPKGKVKNSKDLVCLAKFDVNQVSLILYYFCRLNKIADKHF